MLQVVEALTTHLCNLNEEIQLAGESQISLMRSIETLMRGRNPPSLRPLCPDAALEALSISMPALHSADVHTVLPADMTDLGDKVSSDRIALQAHKLVALSPRIAAAERRLQTLEVHHRRDTL